MARVMQGALYCTKTSQHSATHCGNPLVKSYASAIVAHEAARLQILVNFCLHGDCLYICEAADVYNVMRRRSIKKNVEIFYDDDICSDQGGRGVLMVMMMMMMTTTVMKIMTTMTMLMIIMMCKGGRACATYDDGGDGDNYGCNDDVDVLMMCKGGRACATYDDGGDNDNDDNDDDDVDDNNDVQGWVGL